MEKSKSKNKSDQFKEILGNIADDIAYDNSDLLENIINEICEMCEERDETHPEDLKEIIAEELTEGSIVSVTGISDEIEAEGIRLSKVERSYNPTTTRILLEKLVDAVLVSEDESERDELFECLTPDVLLKVVYKVVYKIACA